MAVDRGAEGLECECCGLPHDTTRKYKGIGYWCDPCMNDGCFAEDCDAQSPTHYREATGERTNAVHERLGSKVRWRT